MSWRSTLRVPQEHRGLGVPAQIESRKLDGKHEMNTTSSEKILIIDDSLEITRLLHGILSGAGYQVVVSNDPRLGRALVSRERPDLVVLDICMPGIDGYELCQRIRQEHHGPIMLLTVLGGVEHVERTFRVGADAFMTKPFSVTGFLDRVHSLLHRQVRRLSV